MDKVGNKIDITIVFPDGTRVLGIALVSEVNYLKPTVGERVQKGIQYTIPNMHVLFQDGKPVKEFKGGVGTESEIGLNHGSWCVDEPLMEVLGKPSSYQPPYKDTSYDHSIMRRDEEPHEWDEPMIKHFQDD